MTSSLIALAAFSSLAIIASPSSAQTIKPGLWEINNKVQAGASPMSQMIAQLQKQMASMPPEQRRAIEDMVRKNGGAGMPEMKDGGMLVKTCISKEMIAQGMLPIQQQGNCSLQRSAMNGNSMRISFSCTNPASSGEGEITFLSDAAYSMAMQVTTSVNGQPETMGVDGSGKWLGADCGAVKPLQIPPAAKVK